MALSNNHITRVAVVGATGSVGKYITSELLKTGKFTVTAITRANSSSKMPEGVAVAKVDYSDQQSLVDAMKDQDALVITLGVTAPRDLQSKLIQAAAKTGVAWIMPNEYGPDFTVNEEMGKDAMLGPGLLAAQKEIEQLGVSSWTGLNCSFWYQYSLAAGDYYGFDIKNKKVTLFDDGDEKITTSTWPLCGIAAAKFFSLPISKDGTGPCMNDWKNKGLYTSSFRVSQRDMLDSILRVTGDKESDWEIVKQPVKERYQEGQKALQEGRHQEGFGKCLYSRVFYPGCGDLTHKLDNDKLGLPKEDLDEASREAVEMVKSGWSYF